MISIDSTARRRSTTQQNNVCRQEQEQESSMLYETAYNSVQQQELMNRAVTRCEDSQILGDAAEVQQSSVGAESGIRIRELPCPRARSVCLFGDSGCDVCLFGGIYSRTNNIVLHIVSVLPTLTSYSSPVHLALHLTRKLNQNNR